MARTQCLIFIASLIFSSMSCYALETSHANLGLNIAKIQKLTGQTGQLDQDQKIYKITIPRDDLKILMSGMQMSPDMGLSSWIAFKKTDNQTSVNGDFILLQDQINPVMSVALANGLQVTGLHNPYLWDSPRVMFMHITGEGDELQLASAIGQVLKKIKATSNGGGDFPLGNLDFLRTTLDAHKIDVILGQQGQFKDDVYKIEFGDGVKATDTEVNKAMALNTWAAFAGSDNEAVVNGTIVLHESELQKVLVKLRNAQIYVLAIYQNMINDERDLVLINFWGVGNTQTLARALRSVFVIAQNNNPANITVGGILPDISTMNAEAEVGMTPIQLSLYKNDNCGYAKAKELYTFIDTIQNINVDYAKQLGATLRIALHLTQKIVSEKMTEFVSFLPATSQIIQSKKENAQELPSAQNLLFKLSVVSNNVPEFVKSLGSTPVIASGGTKSLANVISVSFSNADARFHVYITGLTTSYTENIKLHINSISSFLSAAVTYAYVQMNEFVTSYTNVFKSLAHAAYTAVARAYTHVNEFSESFAHAVSIAVVRDINVFSVVAVKVSQSVDYAAFTAIARVDTHINEFAISSVNVFQSAAHAIGAVVGRMYASINECVALSVSGFQSFSHTVSAAVVHVYAKITEFAISSISVFQSLIHAISVAVTHDINTLTALPGNISQSFDYATFTTVTHVYASINKFTVLAGSAFQSFTHVISIAVTHDVNTLTALSINVSQSFDDATFTAVTHVYANINEFAISSINVFKWVAHTVSVVVEHVYVKINKFAVLSASVFQSFTHAISVAVTRDINTLIALSSNVSQSFDNTTFTTVTHVYANINALAILCGKVAKSLVNDGSIVVAYAHANINESAILFVKVSQSFARAASAAFSDMYASITEFAVPSVSVFQSLAHVASIAVVRDINTLAALSVNVSQAFDYAAFTAVTRVHTHANEFTILSVNMSKSFANAISAAVAHGYTHINEFAVLSMSVSHSFMHVLSAIVAHAHANINELAILSVSVSRSLAHTTSFVLSETVGLSHSYVTGLGISFTQSFYLFKNTVTQLAQSSANQSLILLAAMTKSAPNAANSIEMTQPSSKLLAIANETRNKIPSMLSPLTKMLSPMLLSPLASPAPTSTFVSTVQVAQKEEVDAAKPVKDKLVNIAQVTPKATPSHDKVTKSLYAALPVAKHEMTAASSRTILPASLPVPQHKVIRAATLSTLSSVMPVTHHKVKAVPVIQHKTMKVARLSSSSLPHAQSIKNHNVPRIKAAMKPLVSFAKAKIVKHGEQLNKELSATLHTAQNKHAGYAPSRAAIYPVTHNINRQLAGKITEKPHKIAHTIPHEKNWNIEQLSPKPQLPIHVAKRHVSHVQEEFDDGPAVIGSYPYDEEPTPGGFGG